MEEQLTESKSLSIKCKKFRISKVHEVFLPMEQSNKILWKMCSEDREYKNAIFVIKSKVWLALLKELKILLKSWKMKTSPKKKRSKQKKRSQNWFWRRIGNSLGCVRREEERWYCIGHNWRSSCCCKPMGFGCISKAGWKLHAQCLSLPFGVWMGQVFEKEADAVYHDKVYKVYFPTRRF